MLTKSKIATLAVLASLGLLLAAPAEAKSHVNVGVGIGIGVGGFYPGAYGGYYGGYYEPSYYAVSCGEARSIVEGPARADGHRGRARNDRADSCSKALVRDRCRGSCNSNSRCSRLSLRQFALVVSGHDVAETIGKGRGGRGQEEEDA